MSTDKCREALAELVALKDLKDEESRLRQRRECTRLRGSEEARQRVDAMRDDYNRRKPLAWAAARAALAQPAEPAALTDEEIETILAEFDVDLEAWKPLCRAIERAVRSKA